MRTMTRRTLLAAAALAAALCPALAEASPPTLRAQLSAPEVAMGEAAQLSVSVSGAPSAEAPRVPRPSGLNVLPIGSSQQLTIVGGAVDRQTTYHYRIVPLRTGRFRIGPIRVGGASAPPVELTVVAGGPRGAAGRSPAGAGAGGQPRAPRATRVPDAPGRRAFLRVDVDETDLVVGESTDVTVRAYVKAGTAGTITGAPELSSDAFAIHDLVEDARQGRTRIGDARYATLTWRGKMTALLPGEHEVSASVPATLEWREVVRTERPDPFAGRRGSLLDRFFDDPLFANDPFFSGSPFGSGGAGSLFSTMSLGPPRRASVTLEDEVGTVTVTEPPTEGRPEGFDGAIGRFELSAEASPTTARAGEPITLTLRVRGEGSFDRVHHTMLPEDSEGLRVYPASVRSEPGEGDRGEKVFEQTLVPTEAGTVVLPAMSLAFYDPERGEYATAGTEPIAIEVQPAADGAALAQDLDDAVGMAARGLAPNATAPGTFVGALRPLPRSPWPWLTALGLVGLALGAALVLRRRDREAAERRSARRARRRELRAARRAMREAARRSDAEAFFASARTFLQRGLGAAWDMRPEAVTLAEADQRMTEVPEAMRGAFERADALRFAGADLSHEDLQDWLRRVEDALAEETR